jgi:ABC-type multidrug transport system fused ATPase/permease subunit
VHPQPEPGPGVGARVVRRSLGLLRPVRWQLAALVATSLIAIAIFLGASLWLVFRVVWDLIGQGTPPAAWELRLLGVAPGDPSTVRVAIAAAAAPRLVLGSVLAVAVALAFAYWGIALLQRVNQELRLALFDRYQALSLRFHADAAVGDLIYRLYQDSAMVTQILDTLAIQPLLALGTFAIGVAVLLALAPAYAAMALLAVPVVLLVVRFATARLRDRFRAAREAQSDLTARVQETALGIRTIKAYGNEALAQRRFEDASHEALRRALAARGLLAVYKTLVFLAVGAVTAGIALVATTRAAAEPPLARPLFGMTVFGLAAWNATKMLSGMMLGPIRGLAGLWGRAQDMLAGLHRAFAVLDRVPDVRDAPDATPLAPFARDVVLRDVDFAYEPGVPILRGVTLLARAGEVVALVGPTGAGKSTVLALIARLLDPDAGQVLIDGRDVRTATVRSVRSQVAIALQEHVLFGTTVRDNLRYAAPDADDAAVVAAAGVACADEFIRRLPQGYNTALGERGTKLSTGQRQRLGIARALVRNAPILLLDEPTASLDATTEARLLANLRRWSAGRCVFLVTHRLSTVEGADRIVFLEAGRVVEAGTHVELMARAPGRYRAFVEAHRSTAA